MILRSSMLTESLGVNSITTDKFKTGTLSFSVEIPNEKQLPPYALLLTEVLQRATTTYPKKAALQKKLDELYSASVSIRCAKRGKSRAFTFSAEVLDNSYSTDGMDIASEACELLYELMFCPLLDSDGFFPEHSVEQEKRRTVSYLESIINNPSRYASTRLAELLLRNDDTLCSLEETISTVKECDRYKLTEFYRENLICRPVTVFYIGTLSHDEICERIMKCLGEHKAKKDITDSPLLPITAKREPVSKEEHMPISQGRLTIGFTSSVCLCDSDYYAVSLFNEIFGGSPASKLFMNVREKMSLCYSCSSLYNVFDGTVRVSAGISPQNREITENAILKEFENIKNGKISDKEFLAAKKSIENSYREIYDNPSDILSFYSVRRAVKMDSTVDECRERFSKVTKEDVIRVANNIKLDAVYFLCGDLEASCEEEEYDE